MSKKILALVVTISFSISLFSQNNNDSIQRVKVAGGYRYELSGKVLTLQDVSMLMINNPEASKYLKSAKGTNGLVSILSYAGGFLIGYPIGRAIAGGDANWEMAIVGCGLVGIAIPISIGMNKKLKKAVDIYNRDKDIESNLLNSYKLNVGFSQNGVGLYLNF